MQDDTSSIPAASARLDDVSDLLGDPAMAKHVLRNYGKYAKGLAAEVFEFDPAMAKHVLRNYGKYAKGLAAEVFEFLFGSGFTIAKGPLWTVISKPERVFLFLFGY